MKRFNLVLLALLMPILIFAGGDGESDAPDKEGLSVFVSIQPQQYFVQRIGGDRVSVQVMVAPGKSPATYEPTPRQITSLGDSDLFFTIGVSFEQAFIPRISRSMKNLTIVATDRGIPKRHIEAHDHGEDDEDHSDEDHDDERGEADPHIWMDPLLVKQQGAVMRDALIEADPEGAGTYRGGYAKLSAEMDELHEELSTLLAPMRGSTLFVYHPAFGYFADRYGLRQRAIETGGREPSPKQLTEVIEQAHKEGVRVIFVQPEFPEKSARAVAEALNGVVVPAAPLAEEYSENLRSLAEAVAEGLRR